MTTQPEALRLADVLSTADADMSLTDGFIWVKISPLELDAAAAELRRLHELHELYQDKVRRIEQKLGEAIWNYGEKVRANQELLEALSDVAYGLEKARIWGGMDWSYHPLHPVKYLPLRDKARAVIEKHGKQK